MVRLWVRVRNARRGTRSHAGERAVGARGRGRVLFVEMRAE